MDTIYPRKRAGLLKEILQEIKVRCQWKSDRWFKISDMSYDRIIREDVSR